MSEAFDASHRLGPCCFCLLASNSSSDGSVANCQGGGAENGLAVMALSLTGDPHYIGASPLTASTSGGRRRQTAASARSIRRQTPEVGEGMTQTGHPENHSVETDCVAGHRGLELRRAKSKIISLTTRRYSDFPRPTQTAQSPQENNLLFQGYPPAMLPIHSIRWAGFNTSGFESSDGG